MHILYCVYICIYEYIFIYFICVSVYKLINNFSRICYV